MNVLSRFLVGGMRSILDDATQSPSLVVNFMYYIASVYLKSASLCRSAHGEAFLVTMAALTKNPGWLRFWRREVWDCFLDPSFFAMERAALPLWATIVKNTVNLDKERLGEVVARLAGGSGATALFASREAELAARGLLLRRVTFALLCGDVDEHLRILPGLFERVADAFRSGTVALYNDVFRCLRACLVRFSSQHLSFFWPVVLTELARLLATTASQAAGHPSSWLMTGDNVDVFAARFLANGSTAVDAPPLALRGVAAVASGQLLAACKFIDLAFALGRDEFQTFQWLFVSEAVVDIDSLPPAIVQMSPAPWLEAALLASGAPARPASDVALSGTAGPLLASVSWLASPQQLMPFARSLPGHLYDLPLAAAPSVDVDALAEDILGEFVVDSDAL
eukprot:Unigene15508_Nuclearia_a/m.46301 Unigene15508_Nuclearia_a/g.46301  ORF Unigene15508_Nuclearia_a/g.46301 Unigene15508_Nuclearia_a/m.46301 type:complete len:396 (+) Unigene15508_Nuclearia_a:279-1466(+)